MEILTLLVLGLSEKEVVTNGSVLG